MLRNATDKTRRLLCWIPAGLLSALCMAAAFLWLDARYMLSDDAVTLRAIMGFEGGVIADFLPHQHELLSVPLAWLTHLFPSQPWFTWMQLASLWFGFTVVFKTPLQLALRRKNAVTGAALAVVGIAATMALFVCARITYTQTAAVLVAAAVAQVLSLQPKSEKTGEWVRGMLLALVLLCLAYGLRLEILPAGLAFCGLGCLWQLLRLRELKSKLHKPFCIMMAVCVAVPGALYVQRLWRVQQPDVKDYMDWHKVRISVLDYHLLDDVPQSVLDEIGWDNTTLRLMQQWCFLPPEINTETLTKLDEYYRTQHKTQQERLAEISAGLRDLWATNSDYQPKDWPIVATLLLAAFSLYFILLRRREQRSALLLWTGNTLLCLVLIGYLVVQGRAPFRAVYSVLMPGSAIYAAVLSLALRKVKSSLHGIALGVALLLTGSLCVAKCFQILPIDEELALTVGEPAAYLDEYAAYDEETLFIYDVSLSGVDGRMFPQPVEGTLPTNVTFHGGWRMFSKGNCAQFENYGFNLMERTEDLVLSDNVLIATGICDPLVPDLTAWLRAHVDPDIEPVICGEDGGIYYVSFE